MTPLQITMLVHFYSTWSEFLDICFPAQQEALKYFRKEGLIYAEDGIIKLTPRGMFYIEKLLNIPLPNFI